jgi:hypothetical protein
MTAPSTWFGPTDLPESPRHHGDLLALDPSVNSPGVVLFRHGVLIAAAKVKIDEAFAELGRAARCMRVADEVIVWWAEQEGVGTVRTVIYEWPQIYSEAENKSKGNPNELLGLVGVGQSLATALTVYNIQHGARPPEVLSPTPAEWTGQVPKTIKIGGKNRIPKDPWTSPRGMRIKGKLQPGELKSVPAQHDAIDSVGLGLWALGRYDRVRVFPGAT